MSVKRKKAGLVISWQKSISILAPWRKGKGDRDAVLDSEVVLTKIKLFSNFHERLLMSGDSVSTISTVSVSEEDISDLTKASKVNSQLDQKSGQSRIETATDYLPAIFSDSQLPRLYKFESEDSGVELPSGANSPSTPTGSEQSFVVHSRESSCDSCNLNSDPTVLPDKLVRHEQSSEIKQARDWVDNSLSVTVNTQDNVFRHSEELHSSAVRVKLHIGKDVDRDQIRASGSSPEGDEETSELFGENRAVTERTCAEDMRPGKQSSTGACDDMMGNVFEPELIRRSATSDSLEEYMDECCRLSEDFFHQHCSCGAASLTFQHAQKRHSRSEFLSPSGTLSDLSTIPEIKQHLLISARRDMQNEGLTPFPLWRRGLNRKSYTEGEICFLGDSTEGLSIPQGRLSENYTWGRVKDLVRKTKLRNQSRLGLSSASLKMSCPQLYRPDLGPVEPAGGNRNSMIALGHQSKLDFPWLQ
ncbi:uncharacterized protein si:ch211-250c4.3 isoform X4 [Xiphias gladius]|uniref:uncharacterized protein si:ch211-250c4.3 isoform X4 n=1 Tax=Xiphias gladius TaxID=8245 RepID=UPI001A99B22E|nr:uncharacterized protein si:ch211-250c4.3 isoform X4 [Xiphias gladius]